MHIDIYRTNFHLGTLRVLTSNLQLITAATFALGLIDPVSVFRRSRAPIKRNVAHSDPRGHDRFYLFAFRPTYLFFIRVNILKKSAARILVIIFLLLFRSFKL